MAVSPLRPAGSIFSLFFDLAESQARFLLGMYRASGPSHFSLLVLVGMGQCSCSLSTWMLGDPFLGVRALTVGRQRALVNFMYGLAYKVVVPVMDAAVLLTFDSVRDSARTSNSYAAAGTPAQLITCGTLVSTWGGVLKSQGSKPAPLGGARGLWFLRSSGAWSS